MLHSTAASPACSSTKRSVSVKINAVLGRRSLVAERLAQRGLTTCAAEPGRGLHLLSSLSKVVEIEVRMGLRRVSALERCPRSVPASRLVQLHA